MRILPNFAPQNDPAVFVDESAILRISHPSPEDPMTLLVVGLIAFLGVHLVPTFPPLRRELAARVGEGGYKGAFSVISVVGLVLIGVGFAQAPSSGRVFAPVPGAIALAPLAVTLAFILFAAANMKGYIRRRLRHPMLLGLMTWATVHLLANGDVRGTIMFGSFLAYAIVALVSAIGRGTAKSFVPSAKFDLMAVVGGIGVAIAVMALHRVLFGVAVVSFGA